MEVFQQSASQLSKNKLVYDGPNANYKSSTQKPLEPTKNQIEVRKYYPGSDPKNSASGSTSGKNKNSSGGGTGKGNKPNLYDKDGNYTGGRTQKELDDLAGDPSHGGKIRDQGLKEREIGLDLERQGKLGKIVRDPQGNGGVEFIDITNNVKWDVKSFVSYPNGHTSPKKGAFTEITG